MGDQRREASPGARRRAASDQGIALQIGIQASRMTIECAGSPSRWIEPVIPLLPLYFVIFAGFFGYSLLITVFTPMLLQDGGGGLLPARVTMPTRTLTLGILLCLYPAGQFFGSPVLGALSDRYGRRPILLLSLAVTTACYALIATALATQSLGLLASAPIIAGLAEANVATAQSAIADIVDPSERNRFFGYVYMSASLAYIVGPLAGGKLADPALVSWFGPATPFWATLTLLLLTLLAMLVSFRETHPPDRRAATGYGAAMANLIAVVANRRLRPFYLVNFLAYLAIFGFFRCYPMYLVDEFGFGVSRESEFVAWVGLPIVLANLWLTGFLARRFASRTLTMASAARTGVSMMVIVLPAEPKALWLTLFLTSLALAVCLPASATTLSLAAGVEEQGRAMGNNQALQVGAEALSGPVGAC
jgi:DHA1 family tetracycline resistance protein-like MFS transporter